MVFRGGLVWVISKGKPAQMSRSVQRLHPLEIRSETDFTKHEVYSLLPGSKQIYLTY